MQATKQQQILGYFIEEAKEHLDTIEQGLLNLKATMADQENLNELFRAAHSIKGGAAMLGFSSIQKIGHYLEDSFKLLKEHPVEIDQPLENLFFKGFDTLKDLVEELQSPYGLREENAEQTLREAEPVFTELQNYLAQRVRASRGGTGQQQPPASQPVVRPSGELAALLNAALRKMLELFKQGDSATGRQQLTAFCSRLSQLHPSPSWRGLLQTAQAAIANSKTSYSVLAPLVIKELKQAGDLLIAGRANEITPSKNLQQLTPSSPPKAPATISPTQTPATTPPPSSREQLAAKPQQISIPAEPRAAARALLDAFNKQQLIEIAEFLMKAIQ
ncbi:Hpt domain-containing protein [Kovacikia minuta CCNUW1]|uniref:Hpt domain-containing protein n=1 Tax=Kovacikia minuta TaxID=2931930 RepID=UPI001CCF2401|nr:Hpt domain-containing protein [Kovacikia minuta]UBF26455.1 Hpt domain-containing protein [Kovacikia minuta CCNUW1]